MITRYRPVTYEDLPAIKRAMRRVDEPFRASELVPHLPEVLRDLEPREIGRALLYRGLAERAGDHQLRRRHVSNDQGGRAAEVPGLSERPHHTPAAEQALLHGLLGGVDSDHGDPTASAAGEVFPVLKESENMDDIVTQNESQLCADCANLNSAVCDGACSDKSMWKSKKKKGKTKAAEAPEPEAVETLKCSDCDDINVAERCIYCDGDPNEDRAGDKFIPEDRPGKDIEPVEIPRITHLEEDGRVVQLLPKDSGPFGDDCRGCIHLDTEDGDECCGCEEAGDEAGNPTHYDPSPIAADESMQALVPVDVPIEPWWCGGPIDTVDGMPWHTAVLKCPQGRCCTLTPGDYNYGGIKATLAASLTVDGPCEPDDVLKGMFLLAEQEAKAEVEEESRMEYKPGHNGQSTLDGEPLVRGSIERTPVVQICVTVDKFLLRTTEEGMEKALERAEDKGPIELEQWIYRKMRPIGKETVIGKDDWAEGMRQLRKVIEEAV